MLTINKVNGALGAEVSGLDLASPMAEGVNDKILQALNDNQVLFFKNQKPMSVDEHVALAENFGTVDLPLFRTPSSKRPEVLVLDQDNPKGQGADNFHSDNSFRAAPTMGSMLQAHELPERGGDTCWVSMTAAYEALSPGMQNFLQGLTAVHSLGMMETRVANAGASFRESVDKWPPRAHPVIVTHPRTGKKLLYVNKNWTSYIEGLTEYESKAILDFLIAHTMRPEFQVRLNWSVGDMAFWDNIATCHYAVPDYSTRRLMQRVAIKGPELVGTMPGRNI